MLANDAYEIKKAMTMSDLSAAARSVLLALIDYTNKAMECYPAVATLVKKCGYCERTVRSKIKELVKKGWISKKEQYRKNGSQTSNFYVIQKPDVNEDKVVPVEIAVETVQAASVERPKEELTNQISEKNNETQKKEALLTTATLPVHAISPSYSCNNHKAYSHWMSSESFFFKLRRHFKNIFAPSSANFAPLNLSIITKNRYCKRI